MYFWENISPSWFFHPNSIANLMLPLRHICSANCWMSFSAFLLVNLPVTPSTIVFVSTRSLPCLGFLWTWPKIPFHSCLFGLLQVLGRDSFHQLVQRWLIELDVVGPAGQFIPDPGYVGLLSLCNDSPCWPLLPELKGVFLVYAGPIFEPAEIHLSDSVNSFTARRNYWPLVL